MAVKVAQKWPVKRAGEKGGERADNGHGVGLRNGRGKWCVSVYMIFIMRFYAVRNLRVVGNGSSMRRMNMRKMSAIISATCVGAVFGCTAIVQAVQAADASKTLIRKINVTKNGAFTVLSLGLTDHRVPKIAVLERPFRAVLDFPNAAFHLPKGAGMKGAGLVAAYRFGQLTAKQARLIVDANGPFALTKVQLAKHNTGWQMLIEMMPVPKDEFRRLGQAEKPPSKRDLTEKALRGSRIDAHVRKPNPIPVIVIDPGHGGPDPGATGPAHTQEKKIVLAVGKEIEKILNKTKSYKVVFNSKSDVFI